MMQKPASTRAVYEDDNDEGSCRLDDNVEQDVEDHTSVDYDESDDDHQARALEQQAEAIAKRETKIVCGMRLLVLAVLVVSTALLAFFVHDYLDTAEKEEFVEEFESDATKVMQSIGLRLDLTLGSIDAMAVSAISYAKDTNQTWPFVTIPDFAVRVTKMRHLAKSVYVAVNHIVTHDQRPAWEAYTASHSDWVNQSVMIQSQDKDYYGPNYFDFYTADYIHDTWEEPMPEKEFYLPTWQNGPCIPEWAPYNWDAMSWSDTRAYDAMLERHRVIVTEAYMLPNRDDEFEMQEHSETLAWFQDLIHPRDDPDQPASEILYPLLDTIDEISIEDPGKEKFVAMYALTFYWRSLMEDILPPNARGIVVVFSNPCNPTFTYRIDGPRAVYLGRGDYHESKYNHMEISSSLLDLSALNERESFYSGVPLDEAFCPFTVHVYPSQIKENDYTSNNPILFSLIVAGIFIFTSMVFICYDNMVEMRQRRVMKKAMQSSNLVASLFPKAVRDRLYEEAEEKRKQEKAKNKFHAGSGDAKGLADVLQDTGTFGSTQEIKTRPIADLLEHTTIFFGDLVGFTRWSNGRSPEEVFVLLERLYGAFDAIAEKRGVFKVETIGDCYVAATGLPTPQKDHVLIIVHFARDCLRAMPQVTTDLIDQLGPETQELQMRVGLHSGPTTAGVLRGIKGRFQLFGDTVNTAARMESNGVPGRIQVSKETADELVSRGKGHWLTAREDKVEAKGKGMLQTYFVATASPANTSTTRNSPRLVGEDAPKHRDIISTIDFNNDQILDPVSPKRGEPSPPVVLDEDACLKEQLSGYLSRGSPKRSTPQSRVAI